MDDILQDGAGSVNSAFSFSWGTVSLHVTGDASLVRDGFALLQNEILPKLSGASLLDEDPPHPHDPEPPAADAKTDGSTDSTDSTGSTGSTGSIGTAEAPAPSAFLDFKNPKTAHETATVLAYYLKTYRGASDFTVGEMEALINEAHKPMKNMQNAIWNAGRKNFGWIKRVAGKKGNYYLTPAGENYVKTQLPKKTK